MSIFCMKCSVYILYSKHLHDEILSKKQVSQLYSIKDRYDVFKLVIQEIFLK
jgi:hypothetical protein